MMLAAIRMGKKVKPQILAWLLTPIHNVVLLVEQSAIVQYLLNLMFQCSGGLNTNTEHSMCISLWMWWNKMVSTWVFFCSTVAHCYFMWHVGYVWKDLLEIPPQRKPHTCTQTEDLNARYTRRTTRVFQLWDCTSFYFHCTCTFKHWTCHWSIKTSAYTDILLLLKLNSMSSIHQKSCTEAFDSVL